MPVDCVLLDIEEPTGVCRENWPVRWGVPFPRGALRSSGAVRMLGPDGTECPCGVQETARWPDGSIKWILIDIQVTLGPQESARYRLEYGEGVGRVPVVSPLAVRDLDDRIQVHTGPLAFEVSKERFSLLEGVVHRGNPALAEEGQRIWIRDGAGARFELGAGETREVVVEEQTHRRAVIRAKGTHGSGDGTVLFDYLVRITAFAGHPWVQLEYTFINTEDSQETEITEIAFETRPELGDGATGACGSGPKVFRSREPFAFCHEEVLEKYGVFAGSPIYRQDGSRVEGVGMYEQELARGWLGAADGRHGVSVSMRDFLWLYPKGASWEDNAITFHIWPKQVDPLHLHQGMARTHSFMLQFHEGDLREAGPHELAAAFEEPLLPANSSWYLDSGALGPVLPFRPDRYPAVERGLRDLVVRDRNARSLGALDFGDFVNSGTGSQGGFSVNNEPDRLHGYILQFLRSGERIPWQLAEAGAWHTMDVDIVHHTTHAPLELGGARIHGHRHVQYDAEGFPDVSVVPSHMWTEGLLEYYYLTGHSRAKEIALGIGDCFVRMVDAGWAQPPYHSRWHSARDSGWPLIGLAAAYEATGDEVYRRAMRRIFEAVRETQCENGGWSMELLFNTGFCPFQNAVCLVGIGRYHECSGDEEAREVFLKGIEFLAGDAMRFPDGSWVYVTSPDYRSTYDSDVPAEPFGYAYRLTGDGEPIRLVLEGRLGSLDLRASPRFLWAAHTAGLLGDERVPRTG